MLEDTLKVVLICPKLEENEGEEPEPKEPVAEEDEPAVSTPPLVSESSFDSESSDVEDAELLMLGEPC